MIDSKGAPTERYTYSPNGRATVYNGVWSVSSGGTTIDNTIQFGSYAFDIATGLNCVRVRYFNSTLAVWVTRDVQYFGSGNLYQYTSSNYNTYVDPYGLTPILGGFSGINNRNNYVNETFLNNKGAGVLIGVPRPDPLYSQSSDLGTTGDYKGDQNVLSDSENKLNAEAMNKARKFGIGEFCSNGKPTRVRVLMLGMKTHKRPELKGERCCCDIGIEMHWDPGDLVANQHLFGQNSPKFWSSWGDVNVVETDSPGSTIFVGRHEFGRIPKGPGEEIVGGYLGHPVKGPTGEWTFLPNPRVKRTIISPRARAHVPEDKFTEVWERIPGEFVETPETWVRREMSAENDGFVFVCHSQGCNILMHVLARACKKMGK